MPGTTVTDDRAGHRPSFIRGTVFEPPMRIILGTANAVIRATEEHPDAVFYLNGQPILRDLLRRIVDKLPYTQTDPLAASGAFEMEIRP